MNKKITFAIGSLEVGGAEKQLVILAKNLYLAGWNVSVFVLEKNGRLLADLQSENIQIVDGGYRSTYTSKVMKAFSLLLAELKLVMHVLLKRPQVIHGFLPLTNLMASLAGKFTFRPCIVISKRGLATHQDRIPLWKYIEQLGNKMADKITANSLAVAIDSEARNGLKADKITVIGNGIEFSKFEELDIPNYTRRTELGIKDEDIALVHVANLIPYKGHSDLIEAFAKASAVIPNMLLFFVGADRGIQSDLELQSKSLGIDKKIKFLGQQKDVPGYLSAMDIGVLPSHEEGLPNALIEKLAIGLPCIATHVGGIPEVVYDLPDCYLVQPKNPKELSNAIIDLCKNLTHAKLNTQARSEAIRTRYSISNMVEAYERLYNSQIQK